ncbi:MAG: NAD(P)H-hydrate epimerase, partial [Phycisphaerae bacterium]
MDTRGVVRILALSLDAVEPTSIGGKSSILRWHADQMKLAVGEQRTGVTSHAVGLAHEQMRAADRAAIAAGIPEIVLMENAAHGVLRALEARYSPLNSQRIAIFCGKGNNGGDGLALARLLALHHRPARLDV